MLMQKMAQQYIDDPETIPKEYIEQGYNFVSQYCLENDIDVSKFIKNPENIPIISESVYKALDWKIKLLIKKENIQSAIGPNHKWIIGKFTQLRKAEKKITKPAKNK